MHLRSIQKLEELNVGMENLGDEVKSLTQQCNGNGNAAAVEDNNNPPSVTPEPSQSGGGGVLSSTPQRTVGGRLVPPPDESPVVSQRYCVTSMHYFCFLVVPTGVGCKVAAILFLCDFFFASGQKNKGGGVEDSPGSLSRSTEVEFHTVSSH